MPGTVAARWSSAALRLGPGGDAQPVEPAHQRHRVPVVAGPFARERPEFVGQVLAASKGLAIGSEVTSRSRVGRSWSGSGPSRR